MKNLLIVIICSLFLVPNSFAQDFTQDLPEKYIPMQLATVQIMNKAAGRTQTLTIPVGQKTQYEKMHIVVEKCLATNEFLPEDYFMFVTINKDKHQIFSGWMTKSDPGQNPLQDPDNDLWLVKCLD